jgi:hypothetical protein
MVTDGFLGNTETQDLQNTTIMQKAHQRFRNGFYDTSKTVLLLRNPIEAIVTYRHLIFARKIKRADAKYFHGFFWEQHVFKCLVDWFQHAQTWLCRKGRKQPQQQHHQQQQQQSNFMEPVNRSTLVHVVSYENLQEKPGQSELL